MNTAPQTNIMYRRKPGDDGPDKLHRLIMGIKSASESTTLMVRGLLHKESLESKITKDGISITDEDGTTFTYVFTTDALKSLIKYLDCAYFDKFINGICKESDVGKNEMTLDDLNAAKASILDSVYQLKKKYIDSKAMNVLVKDNKIELISHGNIAPPQSLPDRLELFMSKWSTLENVTSETSFQKENVQQNIKPISYIFRSGSLLIDFFADPTPLLIDEDETEAEVNSIKLAMATSSSISAICITSYIPAERDNAIGQGQKIYSFSIYDPITNIVCASLAHSVVIEVDNDQRGYTSTIHHAVLAMQKLLAYPFTGNISTAFIKEISDSKIFTSAKVVEITSGSASLLEACGKICNHGFSFINKNGKKNLGLDSYMDLSDVMKLRFICGQFALSLSDINQTSVNVSEVSSIGINNFLTSYIETEEAKMELFSGIEAEAV